MAAAMLGTLSGVLIERERMLSALVAGSTVVAGYRPTGTLQQVQDWYRDAINLGLTKLNTDLAQRSPLTPQITLLD